MDLAQCFTNYSQGSRPFAGGATYETIKLADTEPKQPAVESEDRRDLSQSASSVWKDPKRRYSSALALAEDLSWLKHVPIRRDTLESYPQKVDAA
jgi:hypothetical protein